MKKVNLVVLLVLGFTLILFSSPLGHISTNLYGSHIAGNLAFDYAFVVSGFILSYLVIGVLLSVFGLSILYRKLYLIK